jgi:hypothetical protein
MKAVALDYKQDVQSSIWNYGQIIEGAAEYIDFLESRLEMAVSIIEAYGEDEGYIPKRVAKEYNIVMSEGYDETP